VRRLTALVVAAAVALIAAAVPPTPQARAQSSPYRGTTINFIAERNVHESAIADKMAEIAKAWGMTFQARFLTVDELARQVVLDYVGGAHTWDVIYAGGVQNVYQWYARGIIVPLDPLIQQGGAASTVDWSGFTTAAQRAVTLQGRILGLTVATSTPTLAYRKDLFADPREQAAFRAKYGYDLAPPQTYKQFLDVAQFFTRRKGETLAGRPLENDFYGSSFPNKKGVYLWHSYENMILAFGVSLYNPKTRQAEFDSAQSLAAAEMYRSFGPVQPSSNLDDSSAESTALFATGRVAMIIQYFDRVLLNVAKNDVPVFGKVGYALPPGAGTPGRLAHAFRDGPAIDVISSLSNHKEAALALLAAAITSKNQLEAAMQHPGYIPSRTNAFQQLIKAQPDVAYLVRAEADPGALTDVGVMPYPSILRADQIGDTISNAISAILTGADAKTQLAAAQQQLNQILATIRQ